jgi:hypothetical protein
MLDLTKNGRSVSVEPTLLNISDTLSVPYQMSGNGPPRRGVVGFPLLAARLERVSLNNISRQAQTNPLHRQHGVYHHG